MQIEVLFFGSLKDITGEASLLLADAKDTDTVQEQLQKRYPALAAAKYFTALNKEMITANKTLREGDTVALMPPFSGG